MADSSRVTNSPAEDVLIIENELGGSKIETVEQKVSNYILIELFIQFRGR